jgi:hypothetical protein
VGAEEDVLSIVVFQVVVLALQPGQLLAGGYLPSCSEARGKGGVGSGITIREPASLTQQPCGRYLSRPKEEREDGEEPLMSAAARHQQ